MLNERETKMLNTLVDHFFLIITLIDKEENGIELVETLLFKILGSLIVSLPPNKRPVIVGYVKEIADAVKNERFEDTEDLQNFFREKDI